jgi:hypothetical protein
MDSSTPILDLPANTSMPSFMEPIKIGKPKDEHTVSAPAYQPIMDIHPNPFGISKPTSPPIFSGSGSQPPPIFANSMMPEYSQQPRQPYEHFDTQPLPSRDYPRETTGYTQDEQIKPNYIPLPKINEDFISKHETMNRESWEDNRKKKHRLSKLDQLINEFQTPVFLAILFFMFQLPTFNTMLFKYFSFLSIYHLDGNLNTHGFIFKSFLFGMFYYLSIQLMDYFSE